MCQSGRFWTALQVLWSTVYIICGAAQLIAGIFFMISIPTLHLSCNIWTGSWNIIVGICGGILACLGRLSSRRQEVLLYMAVSILAVNLVNVVLSEWGLYFADLSQLLKNHKNHLIIDYACFAARVAVAVILLVAFLDTQFAFCSMQLKSTSHLKKKAKQIHGSHDQVSDIEYIIPRPKSSKTHTTVYHAYSQSWVFDSENASCSNNSQESPYLKILENGTKKQVENGIVSDTTHLIDKPVVHIEEASDDSASNSDRKLCHMRSFSRSASPVLISPTSSHISLNNQNTVNNNSSNSNNPAIYDCLESIYRSRLNSGASNKQTEELSIYQAPQNMVLKRVESVSPNAEKVQYASLMKELQKAIVNKKEPPISSNTSPSDSTTVSSGKTPQTDSKNSDTEFSKELEAALQLIQDLESPNTIETPSTEPKSDFHHQEPPPPSSRPLAWRTSSESEKTLSAIGSIGELTSPLNECHQSELCTFKPSTNGKGASVTIRYPDSRSTSGYSSPTHHPSSNEITPTWSTTSSLNGSNNEIAAKSLAYSIHNAKSATVISLYSSPKSQNRAKSVTLVNISAPPPLVVEEEDSLNKNNSNNGWNVKSLLRKNKRQNSLPKLCPELEGAIVKSESLAYLSEHELLARHQRNKEIQREIEERVIQQLGVPRTESNC